MNILRKILKWIWYIIACPFVALSFCFAMLSVHGKARKYRRNPNKFFLEQRYHFLYSQIKKLLFLKRITVMSNGVSKIPSSPCLFVYNHKSNIDAAILLKYLIEYRNTVNPSFKFIFVGKTELQQKKGFIKDALDLADTIYIDRQDLRQQFKMFEKQNERIKDKYSIVIAPEGTRNKEDEFGEFKAGAIKVAFHNMIPIQPIVLWGTSGSLFEKKVKKVSKTICATFLPYKKPFDFHSHNIEWFSSEIREEMIKEYKRIGTKIAEKKEPYDT